MIDLVKFRFKLSSFLAHLGSEPGTILATFGAPSGLPFGAKTQGRPVQNIGQMATEMLFSLQHLQVGKPAPNIEAEDLDGLTFSLTEYRGKIVMLDFWGHWCRPCRAMYGHEQQLVEKLGRTPFALIGVNSDPLQPTGLPRHEVHMCGVDVFRRHHHDALVVALGVIIQQNDHTSLTDVADDVVYRIQFHACSIQRLR